MKNIYEVFDEFELAETKKDRMSVIEKNLSKSLVQVFELAFHPNYQWLITEMPDDYIIPTDMLPGLSPENISTQLRKLYLFQKGNPSAEILTPEKRKQLLLQILESIEPREAEVIIGILSKDLGVKGLNYKFVKEAFPATTIMYYPKDRIIVTCGTFDPLTIKELNYLRRCKTKGDWLCVGVHSDWWMEFAEGGCVQPYVDRRDIVEALEFVDEVFTFDDSDGTICQLLTIIKICYTHADITYVSDMDMHNMPETKVRGITFETMKQEL